METVLVTKIFVPIFLLISNDINVVKSFSLYYDCSKTTGATCSTTFEGSDVLVDCSKRGLHICIPSELNVDVTHLDVSNNLYDYLEEKYLKKYRKLRVLKMRNMDIVPSPRYSPQVFRYMYSIAVLDFTNFSRDNSLAEFTWPPKAREIYVSYTGYSQFVGDDLTYLEKLVAHDAKNMISFPLLHTAAPITSIDIKGNPIEDLRVDKLARHCVLQYLNVSSDLFSKDLYCECKRVDSWIYSHSIKLEKPLNCVPKTPKQTCDVHFNDTTASLRRFCLAAILGGIAVKSWYIVIPVFMTLVLALLIPSYLYMQKIRKKQRRKRRRKRLTNDTGQVSEEFEDDLEEETSAESVVAESSEVSSQ